MHYYQFHIGDYAAHTAHLTLMEHLAYRRLIDSYHLREKPPEGSVEEIARKIGMADYIESVDIVLKDFFTLRCGKFINKFCEDEIRKYHQRAETARKNGQLGGRPSKTQPANSETQPVISKTARVSLETQTKANQEPLTNNHKPLNNNQKLGSRAKFTPPDFQQAYEEFNGKVPNPIEETDKFLNYYESNGWKVGKNAMKSWEHAIRGWIGRMEKKPNGSGKPMEEISERLTDRSWAGA